jgi:predicted PurR-regulated permease PerM
MSTNANADERSSAAATARQALAASLVVVGVVAGALALWKLRVVLALLLFAFTISAAMRPGVERLASWRVPRAVAVLLHYLVFLGLVALFLSFVVPKMTTQVQNALHTAQTTQGASHGSGLKDRILSAIADKLHNLPSTGALVERSVSIGEQALKVLAGILFTFAVAAYWIFERDRTVDLVASLLPRPRRKKLRDTWWLIDQKLGAFIRGEIVLIAFVSVLASLAFFLVGEPYWLLIGIGAGIFEIVPVVGPLVAVGIAVGAGLTDSWHTAVFAGAALLAIRLLEDYLVTPRVLGGAVGLPPLLTLVSVSVVGVLLGGFYVLLSIPLAALVATIVDVAVRGLDPAEAEVPTVLFPAADTPNDQ